MATKKVKLAVEPIDEALVPPEDKIDRAGMTNCVYAKHRVVGRRQLPDTSGLSELFVSEEGKEPRKLPLKPVNFVMPAISLDGARAMVAYGGPRPAVVEVDLESGDVQMIWAQAAPLHDWWPPILHLHYALDNRVVFHTTFKQVLLKRLGDTLEPIVALDGVEQCFSSRALGDGRFFIFTGTAQNYIVAAKGDAMYVILKAPIKKQNFSARGGRLFSWDPIAKQRFEAANLDAVWGSLGG